MCSFDPTMARESGLESGQWSHLKIPSVFLM
jgi:hypothetical protein